jgi:hypothetical protein
MIRNAAEQRPLLQRLARNDSKPVTMRSHMRSFHYGCGTAGEGAAGPSNARAADRHGERRPRCEQLHDKEVLTTPAAG